MAVRLVVVLVLAVAGCAARPSNPLLATENACARQQDAREAAQDRDRLIADDQSLSPLSSSGLPNDPSQGLGTLFARDQAVDDCVTKRTSSTLGGTTIGPQGRE